MYHRGQADASSQAMPLQILALTSTGNTLASVIEAMRFYCLEKVAVVTR